MTKFCIVDFRMRGIEKEYIKSLGYELIENRFNLNTYDEIASHPDIYYTNVGDNVFCDPNRYLDGFNCIKGVSEVKENYPLDIPYNVAVMGNIAVHNFDYTDEILKKYLEKSGYKLVQVEQGYTKCSISILNDKACIVSDIGIAKKLLDNNIDVLYVSEPDIKLLKRTNRIFVDEVRMSFEHSEMQGFIGGAMVRLDNEIILFGDINKLINGKKIQKFIESYGLKLHYFEGLDVVDYGGVIEVKKI